MILIRMLTLNYIDSYFTGNVGDRLEDNDGLLMICQFTHGGPNQEPDFATLVWCSFVSCWRSLSWEFIFNFPVVSK